MAMAFAIMGMGARSGWVRFTVPAMSCSRALL
jgi:hypothetical protein